MATNTVSQHKSMAMGCQTGNKGPMPCAKPSSTKKESGKGVSSKPVKY